MTYRRRLSARRATLSCPPCAATQVRAAPFWRALRTLVPGETVEIDGLAVTVRDAIPFAHKIALAELPQGATVTKYGVAIGSTTAPVVAGAHVHVHNLKSDYIVNREDFFEAAS